jgi:ABC-type multidrug transport system fused ATPase/permease subunit
VLCRGTSLIVTGEMTAGALTVYLAYLKQFFKPVKDLAGMTSTFAQTTVALERIQAILSADEVIKERAGAIDPGRVAGAVSFDRVCFGYDKENPVLQEVSFAIEPGQVVGIVGPTGSGKSTVLSLLPRFYDPALGRVMIDGVDIADYNVAGPDRLCVAGRRAVPRHGTGEYNLRPARRNGGGDHRRCHGRQRP